MTEQGHIDQETLAGFVYGELDAVEKAKVEGHLAACAACREMRAEWEGARGMLQEWKLRELPRGRERARGWTGALRAAAAIGLVVTGFAAARLTAPKGPSATEIEAQVQASTAQILKQMGEQAHRQEVLEGAVTLALRTLEARRAAEEATLRRDLETVAMQTQAALQGLDTAPESRVP